MRFYISPETAAGLDLIPWWGWILVIAAAVLLCKLSDGLRGRSWSKALRTRQLETERCYWRERLKRWGR